MSASTSPMAQRPCSRASPAFSYHVAARRYAAAASRARRRLRSTCARRRQGEPRPAASARLSAAAKPASSCASAAAGSERRSASTSVTSATAISYMDSGLDRGEAESLIGIAELERQRCQGEGVEDEAAGRVGMHYATLGSDLDDDGPHLSIACEKAATHRHHADALALDLQVQRMGAQLETQAARLADGAAGSGSERLRRGVEQEFGHGVHEAAHERRLLRGHEH